MIWIFSSASGFKVEGKRSGKDKPFSCIMKLLGNLAIYLSSPLWSLYFCLHYCEFYRNIITGRDAYNYLKCRSVDRTCFTCIAVHEVKYQNLVGLLWANEKTTLNCNKNYSFRNWFLYKNRNIISFHFFIVLCCAALKFQLKMNC